MIYARYTAVLKNLLEDPGIKAKIDQALSNYPMYTPTSEMTYTVISTREQLNKKLLDAYKYREIGFETPGRFIDELEIAMNEIMPYYYQLYKSADVMNAIDDPFGNVDIIERFEEEREGNSRGTNTETANNNTTSESETTTNATNDTSSNMRNNDKKIRSDTPQGQLSIPTQSINSVDYGNEAEWNENISQSTAESTDEATTETTGTTESENSITGESETETTGRTTHTFTKVGNQGVNTYAHDLKELRETFLNIDQQIIEDPRIAELFMQVY